MASDLVKSKCFLLTQMVGSQPLALRGLAPCSVSRKKHGDSSFSLRTLSGSECVSSRIALSLEKCPRRIPSQFLGISNAEAPGKGRNEATTWVMYKGPTWRPNRAGPQGHTGLPGIRQPVFAQDTVGESDSWNPGALPTQLLLLSNSKCP